VCPLPLPPPTASTFRVERQAERIVKTEEEAEGKKEERKCPPTPQTPNAYDVRSLPEIMHQSLLLLLLSKWELMDASNRMRGKPQKYVFNSVSTWNWENPIVNTQTNSLRAVSESNSAGDQRIYYGQYSGMLLFS
jgi:hypothetical protein